MQTTYLSRSRWRRPARSGSNGNCVEIAATGTMIAVRDSRDPHGPQLAFTAGRWKAFTTAVKAQRR
jgi:Domain of unknown function (DUF397)